MRRGEPRGEPDGHATGNSECPHSFSPYSPYLPTDYLYKVYCKLIDNNAKKVARDLSVKTLMELNAGCATDSLKVKVEELVQIRRDEEVFGKWRELVRQSVLNMQTMQYDNVDKIFAFQEEMKQKEREWRATFQKYNKGALKDAMAIGSQVSVSGFMTTLATSGSALIEPSGLLAFGSLCYGVYKSSTKIEKEFKRKTAEAAALSFFTAIRDSPRE